MLMHSYLAPRVENKRWTAKIWSQQTKLSGRDQQTWWLRRYEQTNACWLGVLHCALFFPPVISFLSLSTYRNFYLCCFSPLPPYFFSFFFFCLFRVEGLTGLYLYGVQGLQNGSPQFLVPYDRRSADGNSPFPSQIFIKFKLLEKQLMDFVYNTTLSHSIPVTAKVRSSQIIQRADLASINGKFGHCRDVWSIALTHINSP